VLLTLLIGHQEWHPVCSGPLTAVLKDFPMA